MLDAEGPPGGLLMVAGVALVETQGRVLKRPLRLPTRCVFRERR